MVICHGLFGDDGQGDTECRDFLHHVGTGTHAFQFGRNMKVAVDLVVVVAELRAFCVHFSIISSS